MRFWSDRVYTNMRTRWQFAPLLFATMIVAVACSTTPLRAQTQRVALVELFTSEGCSSCPPADALLRQIDGMHVPDGTLIVGLSEHVTYWNYLGWGDPFSADIFTQRQEAYGRRFGLDSVYTPQIVVNGAKEALGSDKSAVLRAVAATAVDNKMQLKLDSLQTTRDTLSFNFTAGGTRGGVDVYAILADDLQTTKVARGENGGRTLTHASVARSFARVGSTSAAGLQHGSLPLPSRPGTAGRHLVVFAQEADTGHILAIATQPLPMQAIASR